MHYIMYIEFAHTCIYPRPFYISINMLYKRPVIDRSTISFNKLITVSIYPFFIYILKYDISVMITLASLSFCHIKLVGFCSLAFPLITNNCSLYDKDI